MSVANSSNPYKKILLLAPPRNHYCNCDRYLILFEVQRQHTRKVPGTFQEHFLETSWNFAGNVPGTVNCANNSKTAQRFACSPLTLSISHTWQYIFRQWPPFLRSNAPSRLQSGTAPLKTGTTPPQYKHISLLP